MKSWVLWSEHNHLTLPMVTSEEFDCDAIVIFVSDNMLGSR